tara:strand:- start:4498 stop:4767 length:270 start_codon:yes stop_codon:yes gene_type:complete
MGLYDDLYRYKRENRYNYHKIRKDSRKYMGYDYSNDLIKSKISSHIFRNETMNTFIEFLQDYYMNTISQIRKMKNWKNYTVHKDDKNIR